MKALIDNAADTTHQVALLWAAIEKLSAAQRDDCVPADAQTTEHFDAAGINRLMK